MDLLKELYHGRVSSFGEIRIQTPEYEKAVRKMIKIEEELTRQHPEIHELFEEYRTAMGEVTDIAEYEKFALGFRTGVLLMLELLKPLE